MAVMHVQEISDVSTAQFDADELSVTFQDMDGVQMELRLQVVYSARLGGDQLEIVLRNPSLKYPDQTLESIWLNEHLRMPDTRGESDAEA